MTSSRQAGIRATKGLLHRITRDLKREKSWRPHLSAAVNDLLGPMASDDWRAVVRSHIRGLQREYGLAGAKAVLVVAIPQLGRGRPSTPHQRAIALFRGELKHADLHDAHMLQVMFETEEALFSSVGQTLSPTDFARRIAASANLSSEWYGGELTTGAVRRRVHSVFKGGLRKTNRSRRYAV